MNLTSSLEFIKIFEKEIEINGLKPRLIEERERFTDNWEIVVDKKGKVFISFETVGNSRYYSNQQTTQIAQIEGSDFDLLEKTFNAYYKECHLSQNQSELFQFIGKKFNKMNSNEIAFEKTKLEKYKQDQNQIITVIDLDKLFIDFKNDLEEIKLFELASKVDENLKIKENMKLDQKNL